MKVSRICVIYFSPTGGTENVARLIGGGFGTEQVAYRDITVPGGETLELGEDELAVFCVPVYGGRVPSPVAERLGRISGTNTPTALAAVFGNRAIDDALYELRDITSARGFKTIAAGEFVAPHSLNTEFGAGRPDAADRKLINDFAGKILGKLQNDELGDVALPGSSNYRPYGGVPVTPAVSLKCVRCGACAANCPVGAIDLINPRLTDKATCISCMRCVSICPKHARYIPLPTKAAVTMKLKHICSARVEDKLYF
jgi:ferredoxin